MREATEAGIHIQTYSDTQVLAAERSKELDFYTKKTGMPCRITGNLNSMLYEEPPKMLLIDLEHKERLEAGTCRVGERKVQQLFLLQRISGVLSAWSE